MTVISHHEGLFTSLAYLFEDRLGGALYYPLGMPWYEQGFWNVYDHIETAIQYLSLDQLYKPKDGTPPLNQIVEKDNGIYVVQDTNVKREIKGISLERFKQEKFDIIIASIPQHVEPFIKLRNLYQPQAKLIFQVGNMWAFDTSFPIKNILASATIPSLPGFNTVQYHQEFSLDVFHYAPVTNRRKIYSFINCLNVVDIYRKDWNLFLQLEKLMPDYEFRSYGAQARDGWCNGVEEVAQKTREATFVYHCKNQGDGFSYGMFTAAACGRPLITRLSDYKGKLAEPLINDQTSIIVDGMIPQQIADRIKEVDEKCIYMGEYIHNKFKETVSFDQEERAIRLFLDNLQ